MYCDARFNSLSMLLHLPPFTIHDFKYLNDWIQTEHELIQFAGTFFSFPLTIEQVEHYLSDPKRSVFKVVMDALAPPIGMAELSDFSQDTCKIARVLIASPTVRGQGIGTQLIQQLVDKAFEQPHKQFIILNVYDWNLAAIQCYSKVGFKPTNRAPTVVHVQGVPWKAIQMRLQRS